MSVTVVASNLLRVSTPTDRLALVRGYTYFRVFCSSEGMHVWQSDPRDP